MVPNRIAHAPTRGLCPFGCRLHLGVDVLSRRRDARGQVAGHRVTRGQARVAAHGLASPSNMRTRLNARVREPNTRYAIQVFQTETPMALLSLGPTTTSKACPVRATTARSTRSR